MPFVAGAWAEPAGKIAGTDPRMGGRRPDMTISNKSPATAIALSADGKNLAVGNERGIRTYDRLAIGRREPRLSQTLKEAAPVLAIGFYGTNILVSLTRDGTVNRWRIDRGGVHHGAKINFGGPFIPVFSPTNEWFIAGASLRRVWLYDDDTGKRIHDFEVDDSDVAAMAFTPDGKSLVIGSVKGVVRVLDVTAWKVTRMIDLDTPIYSIAASEKRIAVGYGDGSVAMLDLLGDQDSLPEVKQQTGVIGAVAFSPDGREFASGSADGSVKIWDSRTLKLLHSLQGNAGAVRAIVFSSDGRRVVSCGANGNVNYWSLPGRD